MRQASAAFSTVEAELLSLHRAIADGIVTRSGAQYYCDSEYGQVSPASSCGDDCTTEEHLQGPLGTDTQVQELANMSRPDCDTVHYSRHQGMQHRPAVRWQDDSAVQEVAQSRYSPQHAMLSPNKSCMKQTPDNYALGFSEQQPEQTCASVRPWRSCLKSIDGLYGKPALTGRKRSRLSSLD